jgi:hypothetical protein
VRSVGIDDHNAQGVFRDAILRIVEFNDGRPACSRLALSNSRSDRRRSFALKMVMRRRQRTMRLTSANLSPARKQISWSNIGARTRSPD